MTGPVGDGGDATGSRGSSWPTWALGLLPLLLLAGLIGVLIVSDPLAVLREDVPPIEDLTFDRVTLSDDPKSIVIAVTNGGREAVTIAQVLVDDAFWPYAIEPGSVLEPLRTASLRLDYPWVQGEPLEIALLTSTGMTIQHTIEVSTATPEIEQSALVALTVIGLFVGVLPVLIGLCWYPFVRRLGLDGIRSVLALAAGILLFLAVDATVEALELAPTVPTAFQGIGVFVVAAVLAFVVLTSVTARIRRGERMQGSATATAVALGIGLHNLAEGLAIGAAFALGQVALTSLLIVGFALHNSTEGLAIVSPIAESRTSRTHLVLLGLVAGAPAILGTWIGAFAFSATLAVAFLGLGVGAIVQVLWELAGHLRRRGPLLSPRVLGGVAAGLAVMYLTAVIVSA